MSDLKASYQQRHQQVLQPLAERLQKHLCGCLSEVARVDQVTTRAKSVGRFLAKAEKVVEGDPKYDDPLSQIQDQIGARVVTFYLSDVQRVSDAVKEYLRPIEDVVVVPDSEKEFDYVGKHFVLFLPSDIFDEEIREEDSPRFFELQIKTLFQHAWSEANHDLGYKPEVELDSDQKRRIAYSSAQAWGADRIFDELHQETVADTSS